MNELVGRIRSEFLEMPGLRLTVLQASRLWGLDEQSCRQVIEILVGSSFLLKPIFEANHRWAMAQGEICLKRELSRRSSSHS